MLRGLKLAGPKVLDHKDPWAGVCRSLLHERGLDNIKEYNYKNIKTHQDSSEAEKSWQAKANEEAERLAKLGRFMHRQPTEADFADLQLQIKDLEKGVSLVLEVFVQWPTQTKSEKSPPKERSNQKLKLSKSGGHDGNGQVVEDRAEQDRREV